MANKSGGKPSDRRAGKRKDKDIYRKLVQYGDEEKAIQIAERCCKKCVNAGNEKPSEMWPACMVQRLVEEIQLKILI